MEGLSKSVPFIIEKILKNVDEKTFANFKTTSRGISQSLDRERYYWNQIINKYKYKYQEPWKKVTTKTPGHIIKKLALAAYKFFEAEPLEMRWWYQWHPLFIATNEGSLELYKYIFMKTGEINPKHLIEEPMTR